MAKNVKTKTRSARPEDVYIGERIRQARIEAKVSQSALADVLGVSFQQVQKYEKGANRVGGSRFEALAAAVNKPIAWFFATGNGSAEIDPAMSRFISTKDGHAVASAFFKLPASKRAVVLDLIAQLAK